MDKSIQQIDSNTFKEDWVFIFKIYRFKFVFFSIIASLSISFLINNESVVFFFYPFILLLLETLFYKILKKKDSDKITAAQIKRQKISFKDLDHYIQKTYEIRLFCVLFSVILIAIDGYIFNRVFFYYSLAYFFLYHGIRTYLNSRVKIKGPESWKAKFHSTPVPQNFLFKGGDDFARQKNDFSPSSPQIDWAATNLFRNENGCYDAIITRYH